MSRSLIKRIEFCKIKDLASNIKIMLRSTSHSASVQQNAMNVEQNSDNSANSINSAYEFGNMHKEQQQQNHSRQKPRSMALKNSTSLLNFGNKERGRRHSSLHNERSQSKLDQKDINQVNNGQVSPGIYREGPCKRTLSNQNRDLKVMPTTSLKIEDDLMPKSEAIRFGRKDKYQNIRFVLQNDQNEKTGLQQSIPQLSADKNSTNSSRTVNQGQRNTKIVQPRSFFDDQNFPDKTYRLFAGRRDQIPFEQLKQEEIKEAKYGETLTKIAEKNSSGLTCQLGLENSFKFPIKNHLQISTPTLKVKLAAREKQQQISEKSSAKRKPIIQPRILNPTIRFGRRLSESRAQYYNQLKETKILKSKENSNNDASVEDNIYRHILRDEYPDAEAPPQRFDEIFYRDTPKTEKNYSQTWAEFPTAGIPEVDNNSKYSPPPFVRRPKNQRPNTAKPWGDVDQ